MLALMMTNQEGQTLMTKPTLVPAPKTWQEKATLLQNKTLEALHAWSNALVDYQTTPGMLSMNTMDRMETRIGHLWAQYKAAAKARDTFFDNQTGKA